MADQVVKEEGIDCGFKRVDGYLFPKDSSQEEQQILDKELAAAIRAGVRGVKMVRKAQADTLCLCCGSGKGRQGGQDGAQSTGRHTLPPLWLWKGALQGVCC